MSKLALQCYCYVSYELLETFFLTFYNFLQLFQRFYNFYIQTFVNKQYLVSTNRKIPSLYFVNKTQSIQEMQNSRHFNWFYIWKAKVEQSEDNPIFQV